ncbi:hypothetical protein EVAR_81874_1 [Eumeta japonica]|uniref:Uncharacterized protein n=1 Tax=Eumeta variegata TaxID=151549 RepID=A0A4C1UY85_EUMVA|nr:hypothetical protein EVAR_81874_1 [Eumeta japonica]
MTSPAREPCKHQPTAGVIIRLNSLSVELMQDFSELRPAPTLSRPRPPDVSTIRYIGIQHDRDIQRMVNAGNKMNGASFAIMISKSVSRQALLAVHNGILIPTIMYGSESWVWQKKNESRINAVEMRSLRYMYGMFLKDTCRNSDVRERCGLKKDVVTTIEKGMLRWFGYLKRMNESSLTKQIYRSDLCDGKIAITRGDPVKKNVNPARRAAAQSARDLALTKAASAGPRPSHKKEVKSDQVETCHKKNRPTKATTTFGTCECAGTGLRRGTRLKPDAATRLRLDGKTYFDFETRQ